MFKNLLIKNASTHERLIDFGKIAEGLLFYEKVIVVGHASTLEALLKAFHPMILLEFLSRGKLEFHYSQSMLAVMSVPQGNTTNHTFSNVSSETHALEEFSSKTFIKVAGNTSQAKFKSRKFSELLVPEDYMGFDQHTLFRELANSNLMESFISPLLNSITSGYVQTEPIRFKLLQNSNGYSVDTNLDFDRINEIYHKSVSPKHSSIGEAYLLAHMQTAYEDIHFSAKLDADTATDERRGVIHSLSMNDLINRSNRNQENINSFVEFTLDEGGAIREAVNSGKVNFSQILRLMDSAEKFRHWLENQPPDSELIKQYYRSVTSESWVNKLPAKIIRWAYFTGTGLAADAVGAGGIGTATAIAIGAWDTFVMDRLARGWRPNQFIEGKLKPLLN